MEVRNFRLAELAQSLFLAGFFLGRTYQVERSEEGTELLEQGLAWIQDVYSNLRQVVADEARKLRERTLTKEEAAQELEFYKEYLEFLEAGDRFMTAVAHDEPRLSTLLNAVRDIRHQLEDIVEDLSGFTELLQRSSPEALESAKDWREVWSNLKS